MSGTLVTDAAKSKAAQAPRRATGAFPFALLAIPRAKQTASVNKLTTAIVICLPAMVPLKTSSSTYPVRTKTRWGMYASISLFLLATEA